jgi:hypothetical protein
VNIIWEKSLRKQFFKIDFFWFFWNRFLSTVRLPTIENFEVKNEPILSYEVGSKERTELLEKLNKYNNTITEIPIVVDGKHFTTNEVFIFQSYRHFRV